MYINSISHYIPAERVPNSYFKDINGLDDEWITKRTGIKSRSKCAADESQNSMAFAAIDSMLQADAKALEGVDLIIAPSYAICDTVATVAHEVQRRYGISGAKAMALTSACSSLINGLEVAECFFLAGKASKALIVDSEMNTYYSNPTDPTSGHLWGDGAVALTVSADRNADTDIEVTQIYTCGLGDIGKGPDGVQLKPREGGIVMGFGRDVFVNACKYMVEGIDEVLRPDSLAYSDLRYVICHQANKRIVSNIARQMGLDDDRFANNIEELGNTGSASVGIVLSQYRDRLSKGDIVALTVFGGGYSCGAALLKI